MSPEEDFKCNLGSKNDEKKQEPSSFQYGEGQGENFMKGFFKKSGNGDHSNGQDKGASPQSSGKKSEFSIFEDGVLRFGSRLYVPNKERYLCGGEVSGVSGHVWLLKKFDLPFLFFFFFFFLFFFLFI